MAWYSRLLNNLRLQRRPEAGGDSVSAAMPATIYPLPGLLSRRSIFDRLRTEIPYRTREDL